MYIYLTINLVNNKKYIGQSCKESQLSKYYLGSGSYISKAIKKYGKNNFTKIILKDNIASNLELDYWEIYFISKFDAYHSTDYYNATIGGKQGICWTEISNEKRIEITTKISDSVKKYYLNLSLYDKLKFSNACKISKLCYSNNIKLNYFNYFNSVVLDEETYRDIQFKIKRNKIYFLEWINSLSETHREKFFSKYLEIKMLNKTNSSSKLKKKIYQFDRDGVFIKQFNSLEEATIELKLSSKGNLTSAAQGIRNYCNNYRWSYCDKPNEIKEITKKGRSINSKDSKKRIVKHTNIFETQILQYDLNENFIQLFSSKKEAIEKLPDLKLSIGNLNHAINGRISVYKNYIWKKGNKIKTTVYKK